MKIKELKRLIEEPKKLESKLKFYLNKKIIKKGDIDLDKVKGHLEKTEHNLNFLKDNLKLGYFDWVITGCYYAVYQASLALISARGFNSKNHDATLCLLIKEYYKKELNKEEIEMVNKFFLEFRDLMTYVIIKKKREEANYSSSLIFDKEIVEKIRNQTIEFVNKCRTILKYE